MRSTLDTARRALAQYLHDAALMPHTPETVMTTLTAKLTAAIRESIDTNSRVDFVVYTEAQLDAVICEADDYATENDGTLDVWGTDDDGSEWRLHVVCRA